MIPSNFISSGHSVYFTQKEIQNEREEEEPNQAQAPGDGEGELVIRTEPIDLCP